MALAVILHLDDIMYLLWSAVIIRNRFCSPCTLYYNRNTSALIVVLLCSSFNGKKQQHLMTQTCDKMFDLLGKSSSYHKPNSDTPTESFFIFLYQKYMTTCPYIDGKTWNQPHQPKLSMTLNYKRGSYWNTQCLYSLWCTSTGASVFSQVSHITAGCCPFRMSILLSVDLVLFSHPQKFTSLG